MIDELKNVKSDHSIIPEGCLSFVEESTYVVSAIDEDFEDLMEACGAGSDAPETDTEGNGEDVTTESVITEKFDVASIKDNIVAAIKKVWEKIKPLFENVIKWLNDRKAEIKQKGLDKIASKWNDVEFKADQVLGKLYPSKNIDAKIAYKQLEDMARKSSDRAVGDSPEKIPAELLKKLNIEAGDSVDVKEMSDKLRKFFLGEEETITGANVKSKKDEIFGILNGDALKNVKDAYNAARKTINALIDEVKKAKVENESKDKETKARLKGNINSIKRYSQILARVSSVQLDAVRTQYNQARSIAFKVLFKLKKKEDKKEEKKEETKAASESAIFAW